ncbi:MAG: GNAT family N-acetyltransferase [Planctomycetes bacterium]|nr:GNAT family N-acetyltransferase [Planctomycetota bacterium]
MSEPLAISIRTASEGDIPVLRALADRIWNECYPGMITLEQIRYMLGWMYSPERISEEMRRGVRWAIVETTEPVGYLALERDADGVVHLHKLYLDRALQGHGIGQAMLRHVEREARREGARSIELRVNKGNARALAAYARAGFRIERSLVADIGGGFMMDDHVLRLALPQR